MAAPGSTDAKTDYAKLAIIILIINFIYIA